MRQSVHAKRMARNHKRQGQQAKLSLVSLMDIFTILVFFLMLNASDVQVLDNHKSVTLPEAQSDTPARETLLILVNNSDIVLQGQKLADVPTVLSSGQDTIDALSKELQYRATKAAKEGVIEGTVSEQEANDVNSAGTISKAITIMGDQSVPYALLKKIMYTCAEAGYTDVSLAVEQIVSNEVVQ
ncbi:biopolymer transporter ExbD [Alteromonas sp. 1_MG-2023]|uniref:ExbD/TolR family protein n=1 Tax=Alteromonas sp. 1_MG-2023 TaxID=3062669 RepID=UPI0026E2829A|nr:biopolymer transporter ExbD [Alteromonas sp. 1_MG-2023]MDO6565572.1 biopolymer transporter ExbD [Alteromonas sp. 1_MG-2023]